MSRIKRFEDLICWQKTRELNKIVYEITIREKFYKYYSLREQIRRAAISSNLNIAEGFGRRTQKNSRIFYLYHMVRLVKSSLHCILL
jgi:four helix bundle protein